MTHTHLIVKYCGVQVDPQALAWTDAPGPNLASELRDVLIALDSTESRIAQLLTAIDRGLRDVGTVLAAGPADQVPPIDQAGILRARGPHLDALLARRDAQIEHLRSIARLWVTQQSDPASGPPATTAG
ncbi:hypothetical protein O7627_33400 [Solwaraspora sp. WMMD1047]|uniref:hypothetical protein n=1 Tax=Solwaraspora sp. WMMD1047 TaxID=3016102 RepID=UPI002415B7E0|nr:hypothetical protein [Solwaraspora sp. WMMD1047]MDG4834163.1 hypothetical protein [Solwaraspora sp. WMMD1047]